MCTHGQWWPAASAATQARCSGPGLVPQPEVIRGWLTELPGPVTVAYEAGPTRFGLPGF